MNNPSLKDIKSASVQALVTSSTSNVSCAINLPD